MSSPIRITVESLNVTLRGVPPDAARAATANLGPALQRAVAAQLLGRHTSGRIRIEQVAPPPAQLTRGADASAVTNTLASQVVGAIARQLPANRRNPAA